MSTSPRMGSKPIAGSDSLPMPTCVCAPYADVRQCSGQQRWHFGGGCDELLIISTAQAAGKRQAREQHHLAGAACNGLQGTRQIADLASAPPGGAASLAGCQVRNTCHALRHRRRALPARCRGCSGSAPAGPCPIGTPSRPSSCQARGRLGLRNRPHRLMACPLKLPIMTKTQPGPAAQLLATRRQQLVHAHSMTS